MANWNLAPKDALTIEQRRNTITWCNGTKWWSMYNGWEPKRYPNEWEVIEVRPNEQQKLKSYSIGSKVYCLEFSSICEIILIEGSQVVVRKESGNLGVSYVENLDPIKPTMTKSEKEKCTAMAGYFNINFAEFDEYMDKYEVVE